MALKPSPKDFRPRNENGKLINQDDLASAQQPLEVQAPKQVRELDVYQQDFRDSEYDFRPQVVPSHVEVPTPDPKDSSALESAASSSSETPKDKESSALQKQIAAVAKDSGQPKESESGSSTS